MNKLIVFIIITLIFAPTNALANLSLASKLSGKILLQVEANGEAWYVNPSNLQRYYMGKPKDAFVLMQQLGLGISNKDYETFKNIVPQRLAGKILIKVEDLGKAYYVNPIDLSLNYLGSPKNAFKLMRDLGLGITNDNLNKITIHDPNKKYISVKQNVPFSPQAPSAQWDVSIFQDACEETSVIMALAWVKNKTLSAQYAEEEIKNLSNYGVEQFGTYHDTSAYDTGGLIKKYYKYDNIEHKTNVTINNIVNILQDGHIVIAPMNGQKLGNIYFTPPGSLNHMIVITGYDELSRQFITNDPGTKYGKNYKYDQDILFNALRDYPTGYHEPNTQINKNILVIKK